MMRKVGFINSGYILAIGTNKGLKLVYFVDVADKKATEVAYYKVMEGNSDLRDIDEISSLVAFRKHSSISATGDGRVIMIGGKYQLGERQGIIYSN